MTNLKTKFVRTRNRARALPAGTCMQEVSKSGRFAHALVRPAVLVAVSAILIGGARAADMPAADNMDFEPIASAGSIWTGPYLGIEAGGSHSFADVKAGGQKKDFSRFDAAFGVFGGYNWEVSRVIWGVEGSATYLGRNKKGQHPVLGSIETGSTWSVSAKTRVGLPINNFMPYLSIGLAASDHSLKANGRTKNSVGVGAVLGAGLEVAMHDKWRLRADYSLTGIIDNKDTFGGTQAKRTAGNHRLMVGISRAF
ncbi:porin family protein [uncultured Roseibium sp.]|uniref:outer membrane protein n=1 Tax=uncultured Roseibium sp. TaxID=1936171 RepID=UPI0032176C1B